MNLLFRHALVVGKRARTETGIGRGTTSVSHAAVEMAVEHLDGLDGRQVAVVGAGAMGEGIALALQRAGGQVFVVNRTRERGDALAQRVAGTALGLDQLYDVLVASDVVITSTGSGRPLVTAELARVATAARGGRPLLLVDIAVPRDIAPEVRDVAGVVVLDIDDLGDWAGRGMALRRAEVEHVTDIVAEEVDRFAVASTSLQAAPLVGALRERAEQVRLDELRRYARQLARLDDEQRELVEMVTRGLIAKLFHEPSVRLREQAGTPQGERNAAAVADLFDLG